MLSVVDKSADGNGKPDRTGQGKMLHLFIAALGRVEKMLRSFYDLDIGHNYKSSI